MITSPSSSRSPLTAFINPRDWPGAATWVLSFLGCVAVYELLASLAWRSSIGRVVDFTTAFVTIPVGMLLLVIIAAGLWTLLARVPFVGGLVWIGRLLPLAWAVPLFDLIRTAGAGVVVNVPLIDGSGYVQSVLTAGLLPLDSGLTVGMRLGMLAAVLVVVLVAWVALRRIIPTVLSGVLFSLALTKVVYMPSALALWHRMLNGLPWNTVASDIQRSILLSVTNGYWWNNIYERFPTAVEAQADVAVRLTTAGLYVFSLGIFLAALFVWLIPAWRRICRLVCRTWSMFDLVLYVVGGAVIAGALSRVPAQHGTWWYAFFLGLSLMVALRLAAVLQRSLNRLSQDELGNVDQPIARGDLAPDLAGEIVWMALGYALLAAWALGWPIFACVVVYLAASHLTRDRAWSAWPWVSSVFRATGAAALALAGSFFILQNGKLSVISLMVCGLAAAHRLLVERVWLAYRRS